MLIKVRYSLKEMLMWTRWELGLFVIYSLSAVFLYHFVGLYFLQVPWTPIAVIGTALAFMIGFQNNAAYGRIWEARKIWGGIVNTSRTWAMQVHDMVTLERAGGQVTEDERKEHIHVLVYRHIAWLTSLRHAMRTIKPWEVFGEHKTNQEWSKEIHIPERVFSLEDELFHYLSDQEWHRVMEKTNKAATVLTLQSNHLRELKEKGLIWEFAFLELERLLETMLALQGKSERIKNFPYPRQYATLSYHFVWVFLLLLPFAVFPEFAKVGARLMSTHPVISDYFVYLGVPFYVAIAWIFHTMERIGRVGENPFEGTSNDVPISTISRGIEIDLREMLDESHDVIPKPIPTLHHVQM